MHPLHLANSVFKHVQSLSYITYFSRLNQEQVIETVCWEKCGLLRKKDECRKENAQLLLIHRFKGVPNKKLKGRKRK